MVAHLFSLALRCGGVIRNKTGLLSSRSVGSCEWLIVASISEGVQIYILGSGELLPRSNGTHECDFLEVGPFS